MPKFCLYSIYYEGANYNLDNEMKYIFQNIFTYIVQNICSSI